MHLYLSRCQWADYFDAQGIHYAFYSAADAAAIQQARRDAAEALELKQRQEEEGNDDSDEDQDAAESSKSDKENSTDEEDMYFSAEEEEEEDHDPRAKVLTVQELEDMFMKMAPDLRGERISLSNFPLVFLTNVLKNLSTRRESLLQDLLSD